MARLKNFRLPERRVAPGVIVRDAQIAALVARLDEQAEVIEALCAQVSEMNLRTRFIMEQFDWKKGAGLNGPDGRPIVLAQGSMFDYYQLTREQFLESMLGAPHDPSTVDAATSLPGVVDAKLGAQLPGAAVQGNGRAG